MATVYLHIGAPKTATSTLQAVFARESRTLSRHGVLYPSTCRHGDAQHVLVCDLIERHNGNVMPDLWYGDFPRGTAWQALAEELDASAGSVDKVVLSSELFFGQSRRLRPMLEDIRDRLSGHEVKVVAYLRRQDQLYSSFYNQDVKGARQWAENAYHFYATHQIFQKDYHRLMKAWAQVFGKENILLRPFEPAQWHEGDIVSDFCQTIGAPILRAGALERNESLGPNQLYIKRCLNRIGFDKNSNEALVRLICQLCPEQPGKPQIYINKRPYMRLREDWQQTNEKLAETFLDGEALFHQAIPPAAEQTVYAIQEEALVAYLLELIRQLDRGRYTEYRELLIQAAALMAAEQNLWQVLPAEQKSRLMALL